MVTQNSNADIRVSLVACIFGGQNKLLEPLRAGAGEGQPGKCPAKRRYKSHDLVRFRLQIHITITLMQLPRRWAGELIHLNRW